MPIRYRAGYKYQLSETACFQTSVRVTRRITTKFLELLPGGLLIIKEAYAWDGPSGPAMDTSAAMYGSVAHDALYQLMRERLLSQDWRDEADRDYKRFCIEAGMWKIRAAAHFDVLRTFGAPSADPKNERQILTAP